MATAAALRRVASYSTRRVRAFVDERNVLKLCPGQRARITADGVAGLQGDGVVENVGIAVGENPFANNASRQFRQLMLSVPANQPQMPIGLRVSVQFAPCPAGQKGEET